MPCRVMIAISEKRSMIRAICHDRSTVTACAAACRRYKFRGRSIRIVSGDRNRLARWVIDPLVPWRCRVISDDRANGNRGSRARELKSLPALGLRWPAGESLLGEDE